MGEIYWFHANLGVVDFETTKLNANWRKICEFAVVPIRGGKVLQQKAYVRRVNPNGSIERGAAKVHGLTRKDVKDAAPLSQIRKETSLFEKDAFVFHNASFEVSCFKKEMPDLPLPPIFDTCKWARALHGKNLTKLEDLVRHYDLHRMIQPHWNGRELQPHRAYYDAVATGLLFLKFVELNSKKLTLSDLHKICGYRTT